MKTLNKFFFGTAILVIFMGMIPVDVQGQQLDNKTFVITMKDVNKPEEVQKDVLKFANGKLDSKECQPYGFSPSAYSSQQDGNSIAFTVKCHSDKEGEMLWNGKVTGSLIQGKTVWKKTGQKDITYEFTGNLENQ